MCRGCSASVLPWTWTAAEGTKIISIPRLIRLFQSVFALVLWLIPLFFTPSRYRIIYTAVSLMCGPLWVPQDAGLFKK